MAVTMTSGKFTFGIVTQEFQQGHLRLGIVSGAIDLCDGKIATRFQFRRIQLDNWLTSAEPIAFLGKDFLDPPARARADMDLIHFNGARNALAPFPAVSC